MSSNRSNGRDDWSRDDRSRGTSSREDYTRANNDSLGESSRSGRGGSWSHLDDDDRVSGRSASRSQNPQSNSDDELHDRMESGANDTSAYGDEHSLTGDRYRNEPPNRGGRDSEGRTTSNRSNRSNGDMGADSWGGASDRDTGRDRYNSDRDSARDDYYGNRSINDDNYSSGRYGQMKGGRADQNRSADNGREGGSGQFSSWQNDPSDMQSRSNGSSQSRSQWGSSSGSQSGMTRGQHTGRGPKGYRRDDTRITEDVNEALTHDAHVDATEIEVKVANGEVTLTGTVDSREAKRHAEDIAESVSGVNEVNNQIKVSKGSNFGHSAQTNDHAHSTSGGSTSTADRSDGTQKTADKGSHS